MTASTVISRTISSNIVNTNIIYSSSIFIQLYSYNLTNIVDNYNKTVLLLNSTINTINLSSITTSNGTYIDFLNYSGIEYNIITDGPANNYLSNASLLKVYYTTLNSLNRWIAPSYYIALPLEDMIINISTQTNNYTMSLPFGGIGSVNVNWGNGVLLNYPLPGTVQYTYPATPAYYSIRISGYATSFGDSAIYTGAPLISSVTAWGTLGLTSLQGAFSGATNLLSVPSSISEYVTNMSSMFNNASKFNQNISSWNTSNVKNMSYMFKDATIFNQNISPWNTSNVSTMEFMFLNAKAFNQDISSFNVSSVQNMGGMFFGATLFNKNISVWSTLNVTDMSNMFYEATAFNQDISYFNVSTVQNMAGMFFGATAFNRNIALWSTSNVINMDSMFSGATAFNQDISPWNTSNVTNMRSMFSGATIFNQNMSNWNTTNGNTSKIFSPNANNIFCLCQGMLTRPISERPSFNYSPIWGCS
jgi:surface protein